MHCPHDIIFHDTNLGTDGDPIITPVVACDGTPECGFEVRFIDDDGTPHDPHDWWVTSLDFRRYEALHRAYSGTPPVESPDEYCPDCNHPRSRHDQLLEGAGKMMLPEYNPDHVDDLYECNAYAGMGNWCGCRRWSRQKTRPGGPNGREVPTND